jgi:transcriptional regulator with XRE-family HTH domain
MPERGISIAFGQVIKKHRKELGLSQEALAEKADVHPTYIGLLERGLRSPGLDVADRISKGLKTRLSKLVSEAESPRSKL